MNIDIIDNGSLTIPPSTPACDVNCIHIKIKDFRAVINELEEHITDTSWINGLDEISKLAFKANVQKTIDDIVNNIISKITTNVTIDIGEYLVSYAAQTALESAFTHKRIPLAELLKEKVSGNPGFDFHTISASKYLVFGEAKFSLTDTPRADSLNQIDRFIGSKDHGELLWLKPFLEDETIAHIVDGSKGYTAAFSFNGKNILTIFQNALDSDVLKQILAHKELYLIAVEIC